MAKAEYQFEDFLMNVDDNYKEFANKINEILLQNSYKVKIEAKASGFFVSYAHPKTKRSILNFLFRKKGLLVRVYADNCDKYSNVLNGMPQKIKAKIEKASVCKRLISPQECNPKCIMGYDFYIGDDRFQKCRYSCFELDVDSESIPFLHEFITSEIKERLIV